MINKIIGIQGDHPSKLNPKTGKAEYLLGIIYISMEENQKGCVFLYKSLDKGFKVDQFLFSKFCDTVNTQ